MKSDEHDVLDDLLSLFPPIEECDEDAVTSLLAVGRGGRASLTRRFYETLGDILCEQVRRRQPSRRNVQETLSIHVLPRLAKEYASLTASQLYTGLRFSSEDGWNGGAWSRSHVIAVAARDATLATMDANEKADVIRILLGHVRMAVVEHSRYGPCGYDVVWPVVETLHETASMVSKDGELTHIFALWCQDFVTETDDAHIVCGILWMGNELLARGAASRMLARELFKGLLQTRHRDLVKTFFATLIHVLGGTAAELPVVKISALPRESQTILATLSKQRERAVLVIIDDLRRDDSTSRRLLFEDDFGGILETMASANAVVSLLAMVTARSIAVAVATEIRSRMPALRAAAASLFCEAFMNGPSDRLAMFLRAGATEGVCDVLPAECGKALSTVAAERQDPLLRQGLIVCTAKAYEVQFVGVRQKVVPQFQLGARVTFETSEARSLDVFCHSVARQAEDDGRFLPHLRWFNERLRLWEYHSAVDKPRLVRA